MKARARRCFAAAAIAAVGLAPGLQQTGASADLPGCRGSSAVAQVGTAVTLKACVPRTFVSARFRISAGSLPPGLSFRGGNSPAARVTGVPRKPGHFSFAITATDARGRSTTGSYSVTVYPRLALSPGASVDPIELPAGRPGVPYAAAVTASGGLPPYFFTATNLPVGLRFDGRSGAISGTPTGAPGCPAVTITVRDAARFTVSRLYSIEIEDPAPPAGCAATQVDVQAALGPPVQVLQQPAGLCWLYRDAEGWVYYCFKNGLLASVGHSSHG